MVKAPEIISLEPAKVKPVAKIATSPEAEIESDTDYIEAYIGAEMYSNRMFPQGCPSFQKSSIKLFKVAKNQDGKN